MLIDESLRQLAISLLRHVPIVASEFRHSGQKRPGAKYPRRQMPRTLECHASLASGARPKTAPSASDVISSILPRGDTSSGALARVIVARELGASRARPCGDVRRRDAGARARKRWRFVRARTARSDPARARWRTRLSTMCDVPIDAGDRRRARPERSWMRAVPNASLDGARYRTACRPRDLDVCCRTRRSRGLARVAEPAGREDAACTSPVQGLRTPVSVENEFAFRRNRRATRAVHERQ